MKSQTSFVAEHIRLQQWADQIRGCQNRPKGMDVATWCELNGITKANYSYRLRRVRMACLSSIETGKPAFVELPVPAASVKTDLSASPDTAAVLHCPGGFTLELSNHASAEFIRSVIGAMSYAE